MPLILFRPYWYDEPGKQAKPRVADPSDNSYGCKVRFTRLPGLRPRTHLSIGSNSFKLTRGRSEHVRVMPAEQEAEYRSLEAEIAALEQRKRELIEEAWNRADLYVHKEEQP
jgi:hypothetical protein